MEALRDLEVSRQFPARSIRMTHADGALVLRPTLMSDADAICSAIEASRCELRAYMPWAHAPTVLRDQVARLRSCEADYFAGRDMVMGLFGANGAFLSMVGLHPRTPLNPAALEVGYWCDSRHAGKGWTTLAVRAAIVYAFDKLGADRVQVMCDATNLPSRRVIEKCGFVQEGTLRNVTAAASEAQVAGGYRVTGENPLYALLPREFSALAWVSAMRDSMSYENIAGIAVN